MLAILRDNRLNDFIDQSINRYRQYIIPLFLLLFLGIALFSSIIYLVPSSVDDLQILTVIAKTNNPLTFFVSAQGELHFYRPLKSLTLWVIYRIWGIYALPNQLINLVLHFVNVFLVFRLLVRIRADYVLAFLLSALVLISEYTFSPTTWVSDRDTLFVAIAVLLFLHHLLFTEPEKLSIPLLFGLSLFALISKESGVILPFLMIAVAVEAGLTSPKGVRLMGVGAGTLIAYFAFRYALFHTFTAYYPANSYLLGSFYYYDTTTLPWYLQVLAYAENVVKNIVSLILPAFDSYGKILKLRELITGIPYIAMTAILFLASIGRKLTRIQKYALILLLLNACVHFALFQFRYLYIAEIAFCIFVMSVELPQIRAKRLLVVACLGGLLLSNAFTLNYQMLLTQLDRRAQLEALATGSGKQALVESGVVDANLLDRIIARYGE